MKPCSLRNAAFSLIAWLLALATLPALAQKPTPHKHSPHKPRHAAPSRKPAPAKAASVKVWVNIHTGIYHYPGQRWYGRTSEGEYMTEDAAKKQGFRSTMNGQ